MTDDLLAWLAIAAGRVEGFEFSEHPGHEGTLYGEAHDEIERLRALITAWADADDAVMLDNYVPTLRVREQARDALRKAVGR